MLNQPFPSNGHGSPWSLLANFTLISADESLDNTSLISSGVTSDHNENALRIAMLNKI